jgi:ABC-type glycerol-3-phosphate transport system permease component
MTLPIAVNQIFNVARGMGQTRTPPPGVQFTVMGLMVLPVALVFVFMQKWFIRGAVEGLKL